MPGTAPADDAVDAIARDLAGLTGPELHERLRALVVPLSLAQRFDLLHRLGVYHHPESVSGASSTAAESARLRAALPAVIAEHHVRRLLDVPCGDFAWMRLVPLQGVEYVGIDIVPAIVERNEALHGDAGRRFVRADAARDPLPAADLVLCRDLLIHLSLDDMAAVLRNVARSGARLLLTNHFTARGDNPEILSGDFRPINLCAPPFLLPPPLWMISEESAMGDGAYRDRAMALWRVDDLRASPALAGD